MTSTAPLRWVTEAYCLKCGTADDCTSMGGCLASSTRAARVESVTLAIRFMTEHLSEPLQLADVARVGLLSPFHFHRVFRQITSTTPARFLTSLRMADARRLLLVTTNNVTEICTEVGYSSLGTFISQFGRLAGMSPTRFRDRVRQVGGTHVGDLAMPADRAMSEGPVGPVTGVVLGSGYALLGMYRAGSAHDWPTVFELTKTGRITRTDPLVDGRYIPIAVGLNPETTVREALTTPTGPPGLIGFDSKAVIVHHGEVVRPFHVVLRRRRLFDPPVEVTRPLIALASTTSARHVTTGAFRRLASSRLFGGKVGT